MSDGFVKSGDDDIVRSGFGDAYLQMALSEHFASAPPVDLAERIVARVQAPRRQQHREINTASVASSPGLTREVKRPRSQALTAAATVLFAVGIVFAVWSSSQVSPSQGPSKSLMPLTHGATWVYEGRSGDDRWRVEHRAMARQEFKPRSEAKTRTVWQVVVRTDSNSGFHYLSHEKHGVSRYSNAYMLDSPGVGVAAPVTRLLPEPIGIEAIWQTTELTLRADAPWLGLGLDVEQPQVMQQERTLLRKRGELVEPSVRIKVPAGEFDTVHVRLVHEHEGTNIEEHLWFARGTGVVRRELRHRGDARRGNDTKPDVVEELVRFRAGVPWLSHEKVLGSELDKRGVTVEPRWLDELPHLLWSRSRFAIVNGDDASAKPTVYRVCGDRVVEFDPRDAEDLQQWVVDEDWMRWSLKARQAQAYSIAHQVGVLEVMRRGLTFRNPSKKVASLNGKVVGCELGMQALGENKELKLIEVGVFLAGDGSVRSVSIK